MTQHIDELLSVPPRGMLPKGTKGSETDWLDFCELNLRGSRLLVIDASFVPSAEDGLLVDLPLGIYTVQAKVIEYSVRRRFDKRVSRLRLFLQNENDLTGGSKIGTTWADTATTGVCDYETFVQCCDGDCEKAYDVIGPTLESMGMHGIAVLDAHAGAVMPFVSSGFGDGKFSVYELVGNRKRVGVEIVFISTEETYPF